MWVCLSCFSIALQPDLKEPLSFRMRSFIDYNNSRMDAVSGSQQLCPKEEVLWLWLPCSYRKITSQGNYPSNSLSMQHETNVWNYGLKHGDQEERRGITRSVHGLWFYVASCQLRSLNTKKKSSQKSATRLLCAALQGRDVKNKNDKPIGRSLQINKKPLIHAIITSWDGGQC